MAWLDMKTTFLSIRKMHEVVLSNVSSLLVNKFGEILYTHYCPLYILFLFLGKAQQHSKRNFMGRYGSKLFSIRSY